MPFIIQYLRLAMLMAADIIPSNVPGIAVNLSVDSSLIKGMQIRLETYKDMPKDVGGKKP